MLIYIIISLLVFIIFYLNLIEVAFVISNKIKLELKAKKNQDKDKILFEYIYNPSLFFVTITISKIVFNVFLINIVAFYFYEFVFNYSYIILFIFTIFICLQLIPKYISVNYPDFYLKNSISFLKFFQILLYPFTKYFITNNVNYDSNQNKLNVLFDIDDIQDLLDERLKTGFNKEENDLLKNVYDFTDQRLYEIMTPRIEIVGVDINDSYENIVKVFSESGYSKLPVYEENLDNIKGIIYLKDLFTNPKEITQIIRDVLFVPESKKSMGMLNELLEKRISICIVVDEFGGTAGLLTIEDLIEELFGEINDEYDTDDDICKKINEKQYIINGKISINDLNSQFDFNISEGDYETIAGYIAFRIGRIPENGETIKIDDFIVNILKSDKKKITLIKLTQADDK